MIASYVKSRGHELITYAVIDDAVLIYVYFHIKIFCQDGLVNFTVTIDHEIKSYNSCHVRQFSPTLEQILGSFHQLDKFDQASSLHDQLLLLASQNIYRHLSSANDESDLEIDNQG